MTNREKAQKLAEDVHSHPLTDDQAIELAKVYALLSLSESLGASLANSPLKQDPKSPQVPAQPLPEATAPEYSLSDDLNEPHFTVKADEAIDRIRKDLINMRLLAAAKEFQAQTGVKLGAKELDELRLTLEGQIVDESEHPTVDMAGETDSDD